MRIDKSFIKGVVEEKSAIPNFSFLSCKKSHINWLVEEVTNKVKLEICNKRQKPYKQSWSKKKNNKRQIDYKLENIVYCLCFRLDDTYPMTLHFDNRCGPAFNIYPKLNGIVMPSICKFDHPKHYYKTFYHELSHAACHKKRLNIKISDNKEEVLVEICSIIMGITSGIDVWDDSLSYISEYCSQKSPNYKDYWSSIEEYTHRILTYFLNLS